MVLKAWRYGGRLPHHRRCRRRRRRQCYSAHLDNRLHRGLQRVQQRLIRLQIIQTDDGLRRVRAGLHFVRTGLATAAAMPR